MTKFTELSEFGFRHVVVMVVVRVTVRKFIMSSSVCVCVSVYIPLVRSHIRSFTGLGFDTMTPIAPLSVSQCRQSALQQFLL